MHRVSRGVELYEVIHTPAHRDTFCRCRFEEKEKIKVQEEDRSSHRFHEKMAAAHPATQVRKAERYA